MDFEMTVMQLGLTDGCHAATVQIKSEGHPVSEGAKTCYDNKFSLYLSPEQTKVFHVGQKVRVTLEVLDAA